MANATLTNSIAFFETLYVYIEPVLLAFTICVTFISTFIPLIKIMSQKIINIINERDK